jgi:hypothetical protein
LRGKEQQCGFGFRLCHHCFEQAVIVWRQYFYIFWKQAHCVIHSHLQEYNTTFTAKPQDAKLAIISATRHLVNVKTIDGVRIVCLANNVGPLDIYTPAVLLERGVSDE